jgi:EAL domain-containing protein (putative c-di-GMP-specific phosphodiesterase class I)
VGIAVSGAGLDQSGDLLRAADTALYRAKAAGRGTWAAFEPAMHAEAVARLELEAALQAAVERGELRLAYQPEVDLATGRIVAVEALMRWDRPGHGTVLPKAFVPLAEETGLILPLGRWALTEACRAARAWPAGRDSAPAVSVNLSAPECGQDGLVELVGRVLQETGLPPSRLRLEVTERALIEALGPAGETLRGLRDLGVGLAIDDFGTGYSSLAYLRRLPVDALKIDRSFVAGLGDEAADRAVVEAVAALGHALGMSVTAEGVETPAQLAQARAAGCDRAQGFHIAEPLPPEAIAAALSSR